MERLFPKILKCLPKTYVRIEFPFFRRYEPMKKIIPVLLFAFCVISGCDSAALDIAGKFRERGERLFDTAKMPATEFAEGDWPMDRGSTGGGYGEWFGGAGATGGDYGEWFGGAGATGGDFGGSWYGGAGATGGDFGDFDWNSAPGVTY